MINPAYLPFILAGGVIIFLVIFSTTCHFSLALGQSVGRQDFAYSAVPDAHP